MTRPKEKTGTGCSDAAKTAVQESTLRVKEMHGAIADNTFAILQKIPLLAAPASLVHSAHDAIAGAVYAAIHHGAGGLLDAAAQVERQHAGLSPQQPPGRLASGLRSALNGAFGDHLAASDNRLAISMAVHVGGAPVALDRAALHSAFPDAGKRLCVFIHGLGCDEHSWEGDGKAPDFGQRLRAELQCTPIYLRYNSGLPIAENSAQLAALLEQLLLAWPQPGGELLLIGHSMGGLLALGACEQAAQREMAWPQATRLLICLGSPHLGPPVERLGQLANDALDLTKTTAPHGIAFRFLGGSLAEDIDHPFSEFLGDGLVTLGSATTHGIEGDVQSARLGNISHMGLLSDARVYRQLKNWIEAATKR